MKLAALSCLLAMTACAADGGGIDAPGGTPLVTPVGEPTGPATTVEIGPDGGRAASADGQIAIDVPPGALATTTPITLQPITTSVPGTMGSAWRLGPEGQTFAVPVTITFAYDPALLGDNDPAELMVSYQNAAGGWNVVPVTASDPAAHTVSVQSRHFSDWALQAEGLSINPATATVAISTLQRLDFSVCFAVPAGCQLGDPFEGDTGCEVNCSLDPDVTDLEWLVNGVADGTVEDGTIGHVYGENVAVYRAPDRAPEPDTVQIVLQCPHDCSHYGAALAFARIKVEDKPFYVGYVNVERHLSNAAGTVTTTSAATVTFAYDQNDGQYHPSTGAFHATYDAADANCTTTASSDGALGHDDGTLVLAGTVYTFYGYKAATMFTGTATCGDSSEPAVLSLGLAWWTPQSPAGFEQIGLDGVLEQSETYTAADGTTVTTDWRLEPVDRDAL